MQGLQLIHIGRVGRPANNQPLTVTRTRLRNHMEVNLYPQSAISLYNLPPSPRQERTNIHDQQPDALSDRYSEEH